MSRVLSAYQSALQRRPLLTSAIASTVLFSAGDIIAQQTVEKRGLRGHDWERTARLGLYGGCIFTPIVLPWYRLIDRLSSTSRFSSRPLSIAAKVALDQFVFAPFAVGLFFSCTTLMEGKDLDDVRAKLDKSYWSTVKANWYLFIPFQTINMAFVPLHHRLLAVNAVSLFWNTYLSLAAASSPSPNQEPGIHKKEGEDVVEAVV